MSQGGSAHGDGRDWFDIGDDDGLARERTYLAWHRTSLSLLGVAFVAVEALQDSTVAALGWAIAGAAIGLAAFSVLAGRFRYDHRHWRPRGDKPMQRSFRTVGLGTGFLAIVCAAALVATLL